MAYQFMCPQGHLLEGEEADAGQQCQCPECATVFTIPQPEAVATDFDWVNPGAADLTGVEGGIDPLGQAEEKLYRVPCPNGHELETPAELFGQNAICPHCGVQFQLREKDSVESRARREEELARLERRRAKAWLNWSIAIGVVVVLGVIALIVIANLS